MKQNRLLRCSKIKPKSFFTKTALIFLAALIAVSTLISITPTARADQYAQYEAQIQALQKEIDQYNAEAARLRGEAKTLQNELAKLDSERAIIQGQIDISQAKLDKLNAEIKETETKITENQELLGETLADLYLDGNISPLEMLASSQNIGDYVDKQTQRATIRDTVTKTISKIKKLKADLEGQKAEAKQVLTDQKNQHQVLVNKQNEQQELLNATKGEEAAYQSLITENDTEISKLRKQQAAELASRARRYGGNYVDLPGDGSRGGYPSLWANAPLDAYIDYWGMYTRECVSYAAFKVNQAYGNMPYWGGIGNANQWGNNARNAGIPTGITPKVGSVGVVESGTYGHVAWVERVYSDGTIMISHYNVNWDGEYHVWDHLDPAYFDLYIYFGG